MSELDSTPATASVPQQRQEAGPPRPAPTVVREFLLIHDTMRHAVGLLARSADGLGPGRSARATTLAGFAGALLDFIHHHHTGEDEHWWPSLVARSAAAGAALEPLTGDHHELDPLLSSIRAQVLLLKAGTHDAAALRRDAAALRDHLLEHLAAEEPVLLPLLSDLLEETEVDRLSALMASTAPRSGLSWFLGGLDAVDRPADAQLILGKMPPPIRWVRPLLLRRYRKAVGVLTGT